MSSANANARTPWAEVAHWIAVAFVVTTTFLIGLGHVPLFDLDEGAFSQATMEMVTSGDWLSISLNGEPRNDKPILIYWLQATAVSIFGPTEFALRLPSALAASLWVLVIYGFARANLDGPAARAAVVIAATSLGIVLIGRAATADALLNLFLAAALLDIYRYWQAPRTALVLRAFLWMALGVLTKGPIAIVIPVAVSLAFFVLSGRMHAWLRAAFHPGGWLLLALVVLPWYGVQLVRDGGVFLEAFVLEHNVGRFLEPMEGHGGPWWYYLPVLAALVLPYTYLLGVAIRIGLRERRDPMVGFAALWFGFVLLFFSAASTKLPHYLLYGVTPLILVMARYREHVARARLALVPALVALLVFAALPGIIPRVAERANDAFLRAVLTDSAAVLDGAYLGITLAGVLAILILMGLDRLRPSRRLLLAGVVQTTVVLAAVIPAVAALQQAPVREAARVARAEGLDSVVMWRLNMPSFNVYLGGPSERRAPKAGEAVLTKTKHLDDLAEVRVLHRERGIVLAIVEARNRPAGP